MIPALDILEDVALAPKTTLELGGPARFYVRATDERRVIDALAWAHRRGVPAVILGGGSNLVVGDRGFDGLVIEVAQRGIEEEPRGERVRITAAAGEPWDPLVERTVQHGWVGLECLSGIPGRVGATPIQNVGAYGQEVAQAIATVRVFDRRSLAIRELSPAECEFGYRDSRFKRDPSRFVVLAVTFELRADVAPVIGYAELDRALAGEQVITAATVRRTVLALRRGKSMVIDPHDENRRSAGSFFTNPLVDPRIAERVIAVAAAEELGEVPRWPQPDGRVKLAAGWLIERAGIERGTRVGSVGVSTRHALALVHHGGGSTAELLALAQRVRDAVRAKFAVDLTAEPVAWGLDEDS